MAVHQWVFFVRKGASSDVEVLIRKLVLKQWEGVIFLEFQMVALLHNEVAPLLHDFVRGYSCTLGICCKGAFELFGQGYDDLMLYQ